MKYHFLLSIAFLAMAAWLLPQNVYAELTGETLYNSRMRAENTTDSAILTVIPKGTSVTILDEQSGWYHIQGLGRSGWTAAWLIQKKTETTDAEESQEQQQTASADDAQVSFLYNSRVREGSGLDFDIVTVAAEGARAHILSHEDGWYHLRLADGKTGWTADWLVKKIESTQVNGEEAGSTPDLTNLPNTAPAGVDLTAVRQYWLDRINALRAEKNLRQLVLDERWNKTALEYATYMAETGATAHERPGGLTMHQWIDQKNMPFTQRYSKGGWQTNYFTENISWGYVDGTTESVEAFLDRTLSWFLAEASYNGAHYRTIYHPDWNSVGVGLHFTAEGNGRYKVHAAYHYGSLVLE